MKARQAYFRVNYYVGDNDDVVIFYFFKKNDILCLNCTPKLNMCGENHEQNIAVMESIEERYGSDFMFWAVSDDGIKYQQDKIKQAGIKTNPVLFLSGGDINIIADNLKKMLDKAG